MMVVIMVSAGDATRLWLVVMMVVITVSGDDGQW
jgi:hypothetical protein